MGDGAEAGGCGPKIFMGSSTSSIQEDGILLCCYSSSSKLNAVFREILRKHSPVPVVPLSMPTRTPSWEDTLFVGEVNRNQHLFKTMAFEGEKRVCAGLCKPH
ncbi:hypothetical protein MLD38_037404 [Melastoma candidum]|uniref:Uncharacterized protein n=1 Tax=Melastoma candidum TaxID=119954 RepID=A0ACB9LMK5_9MYRT|nr:hypothetical protein MLD38_037404 [Melastoma candidum]